ncbi:hypothetical protein D8T63_12745, partial [Vibrio vulnificus]|uniref:hypothetical protein n=1 Tax=Vibrio vulnificus TaxID=672 RepID=UPI0010290BC2
MIKAWFTDALDSLKHFLKLNSYVNGSSFLTNYLQENWPDDLDDDSDEVFEDYIMENIDYFEDWLSKNESEIIIGDGYTWSLSTAISDFTSNDSMELEKSSSDKEPRVDLDTATEKDIKELIKIRELLINEESYSQAYRYAIK